MSSTAIPQVLEVHVVTGAGDLLCRVAARSNDHLHDVIQRIVRIDGAIRSQSQLALDTPVQRTLGRSRRFVTIDAEGSHRTGRCGMTDAPMTTQPKVPSTHTIASNRAAANSAAVDLVRRSG